MKAALRRVIERYTKNTRFCLICNYVNKIIPALQSRCMRFRFAPLAPIQMRSRLEEICTAENVTATPAAIDSVLELSQGDMRKAVNVLQATAMAYAHTFVFHLFSTELYAYFNSICFYFYVITTHRYPRMGADEPYLCVGAPLPSTMTEIVRVLMNESFVFANGCLLDFVREQGVALADVVTEVSIFIIILYRTLSLCDIILSPNMIS